MNTLLLFAQDTPVVDFLGGVALLMIFLSILGIIANIFWIWMMIDALVYERRTEDKLLWFLVIFLLHIVGAIVYLLVRRSGQARTSP